MVVSLDDTTAASPLIASSHEPATSAIAVVCQGSRESTLMKGVAYYIQP